MTAFFVRRQQFGQDIFHARIEQICLPIQCNILFWQKETRFYQNYKAKKQDQIFDRKTFVQRKFNASNNNSEWKGSIHNR